MTAGERLPVTPRGPGRYDVQGATATYTVEIVGDVARCSCPDHQYRRRACKHLAAVWHYLQVTDVLEGDPFGADAVAGPGFVDGDVPLSESPPAELDEQPFDASPPESSRKDAPHATIAAPVVSPDPPAPARTDVDAATAAVFDRWERKRARLAQAHAGEAR